MHIENIMKSVNIRVINYRDSYIGKLITQFIWKNVLYKNFARCREEVVIVTTYFTRVYLKKLKFIFFFNSNHSIFFNT